MERKTVSLVMDTDHLNELDRLASEERLKRSDIVRRMIAEYLQKRVKREEQKSAIKKAITKKSKGV